MFSLKNKKRKANSCPCSNKKDPFNSLDFNFFQTAQQQQQMGGGGVPPGGGMVPAGGGMAPVPVAVNSGPITLNQEQLSKLNSELDVVQQNYKVFNEMLTEMTPGQEDPSDLELLQVSCS